MSSAMWFRFFGMVLGLALFYAISPAPARAQAAGPCVDTASSSAQLYRAAYIAFASGTREDLVQTRAVSGLPFVLPGEVKLVADTTVCRAASTAVDARIQHPRPTTPVIVLEIGPTRRIVIKDIGMLQRKANMLFDRTFSTLFETIAF